MSPTRPQAFLLCTLVALTAVISGGLLTLAVLKSVPIAALPLLVFACIGCSMAGGCELPRAIRAIRHLRMAAFDRASLKAMRRQLDELPETRHPLGF
jgi:hypothetical protein